MAFVTAFCGAARQAPRAVCATGPALTHAKRFAHTDGVKSLADFNGYIDDSLETGSFPQWVAGHGERPMSLIGMQEAGITQAEMMAALIAQMASLKAHTVATANGSVYSIGPDDEVGTAMANIDLYPRFMHYRGMTTDIYGELTDSTDWSDLRVVGDQTIINIGNIMARHMAEYFNTSASSSGGFHKQNPHSITNTSTIASHLPEAVMRGRFGTIVADIGDAGADHSSTAAALLSLQRDTFHGRPNHTLLVIRNNGWGIQVPSDVKWVMELLQQTRLPYKEAFNQNVVDVFYKTASLLHDHVDRGRPAIMHVMDVGRHRHSEADATDYTPDETESAWKKMALPYTCGLVLGGGICTLDRLAELWTIIGKAAEKEAERAKTAPKIATDQLRLNHIPMSAREAASLAKLPRTPLIFDPTTPLTGKKLTYKAAVDRIISAHLDKNSSIVVIGQGVHRGGNYGSTVKSGTAFPDRVTDSILDETMNVGEARALATEGMIPILRFDYNSYFAVAIQQLLDVGIESPATGGKKGYGLVITVGFKADKKGGFFHNDPFPWAYAIPGMTVAMPSTADEYQLVFNTAVERAKYGLPTIIYENSGHYATRQIHTGEGGTLDWRGSFQGTEHHIDLRSYVITKGAFRAPKQQRLAIVSDMATHTKAIEAQHQLQKKGYSVDVLKPVSNDAIPGVTDVVKKYGAVMCTSAFKEDVDPLNKIATGLMEANKRPYFKALAAPNLFTTTGPDGGSDDEYQILPLGRIISEGERLLKKITP